MAKTKKIENKKTKTSKKTSSTKSVRKVAEKVLKKTIKPKVKPSKSTSLKKVKTKKGKDTGSVEVQVDNFTVKIKLLIKHLKKHGQDNDSRRGLLVMVGKRRRLLNYIKKSDPKRYAKITQKLKLKE